MLDYSDPEVLWKETLIQNGAAAGSLHACVVGNPLVSVSSQGTEHWEKRLLCHSRCLGSYWAPQAASRAPWLIPAGCRDGDW